MTTVTGARVLMDGHFVAGDATFSSRRNRSPGSWREIGFGVNGTATETPINLGGRYDFEGPRKYRTRPIPTSRATHIGGA